MTSTSIPNYPTANFVRRASSQNTCGRWASTAFRPVSPTPASSGPWWVAGQDRSSRRGRASELLDTEYRAAWSMVDSYLSYLVPEPDFHRAVSLVSERDGDHYEDTVSPSFRFATRWQEAHMRLAAQRSAPDTSR